MTLQGTRFLPPEHPAAAAGRCEQAAALQLGLDEALHLHDRLQYPATCDRLYQRRFNKTQGLGVTLRWLGLSLSEALRRQETLLIGGRWRAFNFQGCEDRGLWCYLAPLTNCSVQVWDWEDIEAKDFTMPPAIQVPFPNLHQGQLWWSAVTIHALMQPSLQLQAQVRRVKNEVGWGPGPVVGVHVRHGDSCGDSGRSACLDASLHLEAAEDMASRYGFRQIYLATDDQAVVRQAHARFKAGAPRYLAMEMDRLGLFGSHMFIEHRLHLGTADRKAVSDATFIELMLLRDCDAFVGTFGSHFSKVAYELAVGRAGYFPPYVSLDQPWSPLRPIIPFQVSLDD